MFGKIDRDVIWDPRKAAANVAKHGVSFSEATDAFRDYTNIVKLDPDHSMDEDRWIIVGASQRDRLLTVVFAEEGDKIRIISARRATRRERNDYEEAFQAENQADQ